MIGGRAGSPSRPFQIMGRNGARPSLGKQNDRGALGWAICFTSLAYSPELLSSDSWILSSFSYQPRIQAKIRGATIVASDSIIYFGVSRESLPQVIFSLGTAPE